MGYSRSYTIFDRAVFDRVWDLSWDDLLASHPRLRKPIYDLISFCVSDDPKALASIIRRQTIRWTVHRANPQSLIMSDVMTHLRPMLGGSVVFATRFLGDAKCLVGAAIEGLLHGRATPAEYSAVGRFEDGDNTGFDLTRLERASLPDLPSCILDAKPIYRWQMNPSYAPDLPEAWLNTRATRSFLRLVWKAWDQNWSLSHLAPQDDRHVSVGITAGTVRRFREFDTARMFHRARRRVEAFRRPAMFMDIT
jgi:hypothetical protein